MTRIEFKKGETGEVLKLIGKLPEKFDGAIHIGLRRTGMKMRSESQRDAPVDTGDLRRSITMKLTKDQVVVGTNKVYARIHDQGGVIKAYTVEAKGGKVLRFVTKAGTVVFTKRVRIPSRRVQPYKGRGYMTPAFNRMVNGGALSIFEEELQAVL